MPNDKEKLLRVMRSLDADYKHGKISEEKYRYFRSKYEDKLNTLDARDATNRIRSMQGKPSDNRRTAPKPPKLNKKKKEEQDLVQKYIINPKKGDKSLNKEKKPPMDNSTFRLVAVLVLVIGFTAGIGYGVLTFDFGNISVTDAQAIVEDTAFPEVEEVQVNDTNNSVQVGDTYTSDSSYSSEDTYYDQDSGSDSSYDSGGSSSGDGSSSGSDDSGGSGGTTPEQ